MKIFNVIIRLVLEYAAPTFHSMLSNEQTSAIERVQKQATKIIFGWDCEYQDLIDSGKIEPLSARRDNLTLNFAKKVEKSDRSNKWFPRHEEYDYNLRQQKKYAESFSRTERLRKSPVFHMRRLLNNEETEN